MRARYDGFVEVVVAGTSKPGRAQVELAAEMLKKKNLKTTQKLHPLYGRKVKGVLTLSLLADRILCQMKRKPDRSGEGVVLEMLFRRIATVGAVGDAIYIVCRRPSDPNGAFNCHKITLQKGPSKAEELAFFLSVYAKNDFMAGSQTVSATVLWCFLCCYVLSLLLSAHLLLCTLRSSTSSFDPYPAPFHPLAHALTDAC